MKNLFLAFLILLSLAANGLAQWKDFGMFRPLAFGVHDTNLFVSRADGGTSRHGRAISSGWTEVDSGFISNYKPRSFGSIGAYVLATAYRSSDNGTHWLLTKAHDAANCFLTVGADIIFGGSDVWKSTDSGMNWIASASGIKGNQVTAMCYCNEILYAGTASGVKRSTDKGQFWQATSMNTGVSALTTIGSIVFAGTQGHGIFRSSDGGENWSIDTTASRLDITSLTSDGKYIFLGTGFSGTANGVISFGTGVFISSDSGSSWDTVNAGLKYYDDNLLSISGLCVFDSVLIAGVWSGDGQFHFTYYRPISEMVKPRSEVALQSTLNSDTIAIYPNPTTNSVTVRLGNPIARRIEMLNVLGASLQTIAPRESEVTIDLSNLPSGTYFILIERSKGVVYRKIIRE